MDNSDIKAIAVRFAIILVIFFAVVVPVFAYGIDNWGISQVFVPLLLFIVLANAAEHFTKGAFAMWMFAKMKNSGWYRVDPALELAPGEKITYPISAACIKISGFVRYFKTPRDIIITDMRVAIGYDVFGTKEVFGRMNLWKPGLKAMLEKKKGYGGMANPLGDAIVKSAELSKDGKAALITALQSDAYVQVEIFHPKARDIVGLLGKTEAGDGITHPSARLESIL